MFDFYPLRPSLRVPDAETNPGHPVRFTYTNWRGKKSERQAILERIFWGTTTYYKVPQWLVMGYDLDKRADRTYALARFEDPKPLVFDPECAGCGAAENEPCDELVDHGDGENPVQGSE